MISIPFCRVYPFKNLSSSSIVNSAGKTSEGEWLIVVFSFSIFILALLGNLAALLVMFGSRGPIRLTNNKYLVNLACADLLRASFMPFTIVARMKKNFMFGPILCQILPVVQGLSVAVDVFTLVCISVERYIAICRPLMILKLQSLRFGNLLNFFILFFIWFVALLTALPNLLMYNLCSLPTVGRFKCEKDKTFSLFRLRGAVFYFLLPMLIMVVLYAMIIRKMYKNNTATRMRSFHHVPPPSKTISNSSSGSLTRRSAGEGTRQRAQSDYHQYEPVTDLRLNSSWPKHVNKSNPPSKCSSHPRTNSNRSHSSSSHPAGVDRHRRKALKLLIVIIVEFVLCWTPMFIYHTFGTFNKKFYRSMPSILVDLILLFSFASPLCNPLTYYFMSKRYRAVLFAHFACFNWKTKLHRKNEEAMQVLKALRLHQEQNSLEYKPKSRSNTLY